MFKDFSKQLTKSSELKISEDADETKIFLKEYLAKKGSDREVEIKKIYENCYIIICGTKSEAKKILTYDLENHFKIRPLNDSKTELK